MHTKKRTAMKRASTASDYQQLAGHAGTPLPLSSKCNLGFSQSKQNEPCLTIIWGIAEHSTVGSTYYRAFWGSPVLPPTLAFFFIFFFFKFSPESQDTNSCRSSGSHHKHFGHWGYLR